MCLIPASAHGTNPASAIVAGYEVVPVNCDDGDIEWSDLEAKAKAYADRLGAIMVTYPSTHGVFEDSFVGSAIWCMNTRAWSTSMAAT